MPPEMHEDIAKRSQEAGTSLGRELEADWRLSKSLQGIIRDDKGSMVIEGLKYRPVRKGEMASLYRKMEETA